MAEYIRNQYNILRERIGEPRKFMQVLAGPRQVGKSTLVQQVLKDVTLPYTLVNADGINHEDTDWIRRVWESVRINMQLQHEEEHLLVIDEVQKIDNWSTRSITGGSGAMRWISLSYQTISPLLSK